MNNRKVILGDPKLSDKKGHVSLIWADRLVADQFKGYHNNLNEVENADINKGWGEHIEQVVLDEESTNLSVRWFEYKGKSCGNKKPPLVISFFEYFNTCWQRIADREGLVVVTFEYHRNSRLPEGGRGALGFGPRPDEMASYHYVAEKIIEKYNCDRERLYVSGLSYGDLSTLMYIKRYGHELAGAVNMNGPSCWYNIERLDLNILPSLPMMHIRSNDDFSCDGFPAGLTFELAGNEEWIRNVRSHVVVSNRTIALNSNKIDSRVPCITSTKKRMFLRYPSENGDVIMAEYFGKSHILPIDTAEVIWEMLFSRYKRDADGKIKEISSAPSFDEGAIGLVAGCSKAYINNSVVELSAPCLILDPEENLSPFIINYVKTESTYSSFYASIEILQKGFGISYELEFYENASRYWVHDYNNPRIEFKDGVIRFKNKEKQYELYINTCLACVDGKFVDIERPALFVDNQLMIPVKEIAALLGLHFSSNDDVAYITDHEVNIGFTVARLFREEILADKIEDTYYPVKLIQAMGGEIVLEQESPVLEGTTLRIRIKPYNGYKVKKLWAFFNGQSVPTYHIKDDLYYVCNALGDIEIEAEFEEEI